MLMPGVRLVERPGALHFVDGRRVVSLQVDSATRAQIVAALGLGGAAPVADPDADDLRRPLVELGLAVDDMPSAGEPGAAFATAGAAGRVDLATVQARLGATTVHVLGGDGALLDELSACGLPNRAMADLSRIGELDPASDLVVAVAGEARAGTELRAVNAGCLAAGMPWLPISPFDGAVLRVGPLILPGRTACFECTERRLAANVEYSQLYLDVVADAPAAPTPRALRSWAYALASLTLLRWVANRDPRVPGRLLTLVADDLSVRPALVYRVPRCRECSGPDYLMAAAPWAVGRDH
jgi:bacteriocin biosynthesis cyclodehydratase domain-containing protein